MINLRKFETEAQYNAYADSEEYVIPNVSSINELGSVKYNKPHDYSKDYLTTIAREAGTISFNILKNMGTDLITSISYSTDGGETWVITQNRNRKSQNLVINVSVNEGDKVLWKGTAQQTGYLDEYEGIIVGSFFSSTSEFDAEGNIMSLLYGDNFISETELEYVGQFTLLFYDYAGEKACYVVNAENLVLPATALTTNCYAYMFFNCTSLTTAPSILPATTLAQSCYSNMFQDCTSLTTAPSILPATTLAQSCYYGMFESCTSLTTAPELPATTLAQSCYSNMFQDCTSLTTAPELPATTLTESCYREMFQNCTSLTTAPELPATTLANSCYYYIFNGCTKLATAPALPATTLATRCYQGMFKGCTLLTTAPELPATTLANNCYNNMFRDCTSLNYIKCLATDISASGCTSNWVEGVASTGTFVKNASMSNWTTGINGIPTNWTVQDAS